VNLAPLVEAVARARNHVPRERAVLAALSGIDASGKGYVTARLADSLESAGLRVASIGIDGWLNLPAVRFSKRNPAEHFYQHAFRFEEMFETLVLPLRDTRTIRLQADYTEETATAYRRHVYAFDDVDVLLLEGIYLFQLRFLPFYDLSVWIDCTFETAVERAVARGQEGLAPEETRRAFRTIYLPAQEIHFERDRPKEKADRILVNDPKLAPLPRSLDPEDLNAVTQGGVYSVSES
jgi:uridine kinase